MKAAFGRPLFFRASRPGLIAAPRCEITVIITGIATARGPWGQPLSAAPAEKKLAGEREEFMSVVKVIEVLSQSDKSWEDAAQNAVKIASKTVKDIKSIYIENFEAKVENGKITKYRINGKLTFALKGTEKL